MSLGPKRCKNCSPLRGECERCKALLRANSNVRALRVTTGAQALNLADALKKVDRLKRCTYAGKYQAQQEPTCECLTCWKLWANQLKIERDKSRHSVVIAAQHSAEAEHEARMLKAKVAELQEALEVLQVTETVTLWRAVGDAELRLIQESGMRQFPPRLPEQPLFYPVCNERYAREIAECWNAEGVVVRFEVKADFLVNRVSHLVGARYHVEYWIPAGELSALNEAIVGKIEVVQ